MSTELPPDDGSTRVLPLGSDDATRIVTAPPVRAPAAPPAPSSAAESSGQSGVLAVGTQVAEFEITSLVGQGGFGIVYEAWDHTLERVVAIKEYMPSSLASRQDNGTVVPLSQRHQETFDLGMRSFINEARLLAQFDHPSLLKVYRFWQEKGTTYMVMPLYRGDTLKQALAQRQGDVDEAWLLSVMDGVTQALAVMHGAQCYHRDIAPDNILLLEGSGLPVVLDFGAARRVITDKTQAITVILKPGYAPIEQYAEVPDMAQGAWTDVYALCAVMHVAITGRSPPPSVARLLNDGYQPLAGNEALGQRFSRQTLAAVDAGLAVRPQDRLQSMAELRAALGLRADGRTLAGAAAVAAAAPVLAALRAGTGVAGNAGQKPSSPPAVPSASPKRTPLFAGLAVLALVLGGAGWWWQGQQADAPGAAPAPGTTSATSPTPVAQAPAAAPASSGALAPVPPPAPAPAPVFSPSRSLGNIVAGASPGFEVKTVVARPEVRVGKDRLEFQVQSNRDGFLYVFLLSSGGDMFLLFPNALDKRNRVSAGASVALPRASWPMEAGGPPGTNEFVALVSAHERDFRKAGMQQDGVFGQFPLPILGALEAAQPQAPSPLRGEPQCDGAAPCTDAYGAVLFKIVEK